MDFAVRRGSVPSGRRADFSSGGGGGGPLGRGSSDDDDDDDGGGPDDSSLRGAMAGRMAQMFSSGPGGAPTDPQVTALVQAAVKGDTDEIDRLLSAGVSIDAEGPAALAGPRTGAIVQ